MTDELARTRTATLFLEPWPMRGGHDGVLGEGVEVGVQFWEESPDGDLLAPGPNRYGDRVPGRHAPHHHHGRGRRGADPRGDGAADRRRLPLRRRRRLHLGRRRRRGLARRPRRADPRARRHPERARRRRLALPQPRRAALLDAQHPPLRAVGATDPPRHRRPGAVVARHDARPRAGRRPPRRSCRSRRCRPSARTRSRPGCTPCPTSPSTSSTSTTTSSSAGRDAPSTSSRPGGQYAAFVADHRAVGLPGTDDRPYLTAAQNNRRVLADAFGVALTHTMMHSPHPQRRTTLEEIAARFPAEVERTTHAPFRSETDLSMLSSFAQTYGLITGQAFRAGAHHGYVDLGHQQLPAQLKADAPARPRLLLHRRQPPRRLRRGARRRPAPRVPRAVLPDPRPLGARLSGA